MSAGPLPVPEALSYAIALAEELREVHGRRRVYAFLQPAGVAILDGRVRLVPLGPATVSPYFSPEQVAGRDLDPRTDIFSLGAMMYEMLSGRRAFGAATQTALRIEILNHEPASLENVPPALARLVQRCLEKKPERRVQRMEILLAELKLQKIISRPVESMQPGARPVTPLVPPRKKPGG
jgi:serine/threonine protein kinase